MGNSREGRQDHRCHVLRSQVFLTSLLCKAKNLAVPGEASQHFLVVCLKEFLVPGKN